MSTNLLKYIIFSMLICLALQSCERQSAFQKLIEIPVVDSHVESGTGFRREYYVYEKNGVGEINVFDDICKKVSLKFNNRDIYEPGRIMFEINKFGNYPDIPKGFDVKYTSNIKRYYLLIAKDRMSSIDLYESEDYVFVLLADGY